MAHTSLWSGTILENLGARDSPVGDDPRAVPLFTGGWLSITWTDSLLFQFVHPFDSRGRSP